MTVSRVINGSPRVSPATRARVMNALDRLDYRVNVAARNLRVGRTGVIGVAVPDFDNPYMAQVADLVTEQAAHVGYKVVIEVTGARRELELDALAQSRTRMYDGLLLSTLRLEDADVSQVGLDFPVVVLGERLTTSALDHVRVANREGVRDATALLIGKGCTRIAAIGGRTGEEADTSTLRTHGYMDALSAHGLAFDEALVVDCGLSAPGGADAVHQLVASGVRFDGAVCFTDWCAIGALRALKDLGASVPDDILLIGFDNIAQTEYTVPSLSSVDPGLSAMVGATLRMLVDRIEGRRSRTDVEEYVGPYSLVLRESTDR